LSSYADSSFLVSLYAPDANSAGALQILPQLSPPIIITWLGELELENAFELRKFRRQIGATEGRLGSDFRADVSSGVVIVEPMTEAIYLQARRLAATWTHTLGTRTLDIIHVAAATFLKADVFLTFDRRQRNLAEAAGLVCL